MLSYIVKLHLKFISETCKLHVNFTQKITKKLHVRFACKNNMINYMKKLHENLVEKVPFPG